MKRKYLKKLQSKQKYGIIKISVLLSTKGLYMLRILMEGRKEIWRV